VRAVLLREGVDPDLLRLLPGRGPRRPIARLIGPITGQARHPVGHAIRRPGTGSGVRVVVELAIDGASGYGHAAGRLRLQRELWGRCWAAAAGLPTPTVLGADPAGGWLVSSWLEPAVPTGPGFLDAAVETAARIAAAPPPPPGPPRSVWRSPLRSAPLRLARGALGGVPTQLWWAARQAVARLPQVPVAHGDYYHRNVLWCPGRGGLYTVDWEYLGPGVRHSDLLRLWSVLPDPADRAGLLARLLDDVPAAERAEIATLGLYLALRLLGENVKCAPRDRDATDLAHARAIQPEAHALAQTHGGWPR
jgi:hypothetical protein